MWEAVRGHPEDRAARARLSRHLRVLGDAAWRAGASAVESSARVADRNLPHIVENGTAVFEALLDQLLDSMAAMALRDAPAIAARMPMVVLDAVADAGIGWLAEILVASGCQVHESNDATQLPGPAAGHLVVLGPSAVAAGRLRAWRTAVVDGSLPLRIVLLGSAPDYGRRNSWIDADAVIARDADPQALLATLEGELAALGAASPCVALLGLDAELHEWTAAFAAHGFLAAPAASVAEVWERTMAGGVDAVMVGPGVECMQTIELARTLAQSAGSARARVVSLGASDADAGALFAAGVATLPAALSPPVAAEVLRERLQRRRRPLEGDADPVSGALRRAPFLLMMQGMLEGPAAFVGLGVIDLDGLRAVNLEHGREIGNLTLRAAARRLRAALPATAALGRAGSDEFLFGFTARNEAEARRLMAQAASPPAEDSRLPRIGHCIGGVLLDRDDRQQRVTLAELLARAGELMLDSKASNGSRIALARYGERPIGDRWF
jgi:GGDEF domain-containing protein